MRERAAILPIALLFDSFPCKLFSSSRTECTRAGRSREKQELCRASGKSPRASPFWCAPFSLPLRDSPRSFK